MSKKLKMADVFELPLAGKARRSDSFKQITEDWWHLQDGKGIVGTIHGEDHAGMITCAVNEYDEAIEIVRVVAESEDAARYLASTQIRALKLLGGRVDE